MARADAALDRPDELIAIYAADDGLAGHLRYVAGMLRGERCALCTITHSGVREKRTFRACRRALPVPLQVIYRDAATDAMRAAAGPLPAVVARFGGRFERALGADELAACGGSVERFRDALLGVVAPSERAAGHGPPSA